MLFTLLSAGLFYLAFPNCFSMYGFWPCIWVFAVPLLMALRDQPLRKRVGYCIVWGVCAYGLMARGLIGISPAGFAGFVAALSLQAVIFAFIVRCSGNALIDVFYFAVAWSFSELVRNGVLGGFSFFISHAQAFCPLMLKLYSIFGCLGMSAVIFLVNSLIYAAISYKQYRLYFIVAAAVVFLSVLGGGFVNENRDSALFCSTNSQAKIGRCPYFRIGVIQANISPLAKMDLNLFDHNAALHLHLTEQAYGQAHPDLIIWPETAYPDDLMQSDQWRPVVLAEATHTQADILLGDAPIIDGKEYNSALLINAQGQVGGLYHKEALVPFAETTPLESWGIHWGRGYHFRAGDKPGIFALRDGSLKFGVVICSESAHPSMVRRLRKLGARFLVELSNDGWFTDKASYMLHAQAAVMRAVENRMWVIRAANTGLSFAVDPGGVIHTSPNLKLGREGFGIFDIMANDPNAAS